MTLDFTNLATAEEIEEMLFAVDYNGNGGFLGQIARLSPAAYDGDIFDLLGKIRPTFSIGKEIYVFKYCTAENIKISENCININNLYTIQKCAWQDGSEFVRIQGYSVDNDGGFMFSIPRRRLFSEGFAEIFKRMRENRMAVLKDNLRSYGIDLAKKPEEKKGKGK